MPIHYECAQCGAAMSIKDDRAGTTAKCPQCKERFVVPQREVEVAALSERRGAASGPDAESVEMDVVSASAGLSSDTDVLSSQVPSSQKDTDDSLDAESVLVSSGENPVIPSNRFPRDSSPDDGVLRLDTSDEEDEAAASAPRRGFEFPAAEPAGDDPDRPHRGPIRDRKASGSASSVAGDLLKTRKAEDAGKRKAAASNPYAFAERPERREENRPDLVETAKHVSRSFLLPLLGVLVGCVLLYWLSSSMFKTRKLPDMARVSGVVTLDGAPVPGAAIEFHPAEGQKPGVLQGSSFGVSDEQGRYTLTYLQDVKGAVVGEHHVQIHAADANGRERLEPRYNRRTTLKCTVEPGSNTKNWELTSEKDKK